MLRYTLVIFTALHSWIGFAQTVNIGEVTITQGTIFSTLSNLDNQTSGTFINNGDAYIYANWNNDGVVDFDPVILGSTNGLTRFVGNSIQTLSGSEMSFFNNVLFDNSSSQYAFELSGDISVSSEVNYSQGIVDNDNFGGTFQIDQDGIDVNTSDVSHVNGPVLKIGDQAFTYPIGDGGFYRPSGITDGGATTDSYTSKYFFEATDTNYPTSNLSNQLELVDANEHWTIDRTTGNSEVMITLSWRDLTTPNNILAAPLQNITIAYWNPTTSLWENRPSVVDEVNQTVTTITNVQDFGVFTLARLGDEEQLPCNLTRANTLITPNNDGLNDNFQLGNVENTLDDCINSIALKVFNRWGVKVYESDNYGENEDFFDGFSDGRLTVNQSDRLPTGTYYYVLEINYDITPGNPANFQEVDYLYINGDN